MTHSGHNTNNKILVIRVIPLELILYHWITVVLTQKTLPALGRSQNIRKIHSNPTNLPQYGRYAMARI